jgi:ribosomal protein S12 methylthiotransferase accessory factor
MASPPISLPEPALRRAFGVTRLARVTGLDRTGVEVACAVRPLGHVLQVCNGKGETFAQAAASALSEAAELWAAERVDSAELEWGSFEELWSLAPGTVWGADEVGSAGPLAAPSLWSPRTRIAWRVATELFSGDPVRIPAQAVHCPPPGSAPLGPAVVAWSSNGSGAHPDPAEALRHALLEAVERDQLARALPGGWTEEEVARRMIAPASLPPSVSAWRERLHARDFALHLFDLSPELSSDARKKRRALDVGLPVAGALLFDTEQGPVPLTAGYACGLSAEGALMGALLEAAQSRLTDIHGAREDVSQAAPEGTDRLRAACAGLRPRRKAEALPRIEKPKGARTVLERLAGVGHNRAAALELAPASSGLSVVKVVVPGLWVSELL